MQFNWTNEAVEIMRLMLADGATMREVANAIGASRNAVIGKSNRMGFQSARAQGSHIAKVLKPTHVPRASIAKPTKTVRTQSDTPAVNPKRERFAAIEAPPPAHGVTLMELTAAHCYFPHGDPKYETFRYCGAEAAPGKDYCLHHHGIMYVAAPKREPKKQTDDGRGARAMRDLGRFARFATGAMQ